MFLKTKKAETAALTGSTNQAKKHIPTLVAADMHILGNAVTEGVIDIDGTIDGNVKAQQVTLRANGKVNGDIVAEAVHVYGAVRGLIRAQNVFLYSSCHVEGVIMYKSMSVEDGAFVDGKFKRMQDKLLIGTVVSDTLDIQDEDSGEDGEILPNGLGTLRLIG